MGREVPSTPLGRKLALTYVLMGFHNYPQLSHSNLQNEPYADYHQDVRTICVLHVFIQHKSSISKLTGNITDI